MDTVLSMHEVVCGLSIHEVDLVLSIHEVVCGLSIHEVDIVLSMHEVVCELSIHEVDPVLSINGMGSIHSIPVFCNNIRHVRAALRLFVN